MTKAVAVKSWALSVFSGRRYSTNTSPVPVLSSPTPSGMLGTSTTATVGVTTTINSGTLYAVIDTAANLVGITAAQIKGGQNKNSSAAVASGNAAVSTTTPSVALTGLTASTGYSYACVQHVSAGDSNGGAGTFTTAAAASFATDPFSAYGTRLVDPTISSDVAGGTTATRTWNGVSTSYQCYKTIQFAMSDYLTTGGRRVVLLAATTYTNTADLYFPASGSSDANRVVLQGDPSAVASMSHIDCNGSSTTGTSKGINVNLNNSANYATIRGIELSNISETANSTSGITCNPGLSSYTADGLVIEFCYLHDFQRNNGNSDIGCIGLSQTTFTPGLTPIIRYTKLWNCNQGGNGKTAQGNTSGLYVDKCLTATIQNCDINNCGNGLYHKVGTAGASVGAPNGLTLTYSIVRTTNVGFYLGGAGASVNGYFGTTVNNNLFYDIANNAVKSDSNGATPQCDTFSFFNNTVAQDVNEGADWYQTNNIHIYNNVSLASAVRHFGTDFQASRTNTIVECNFNGYSSGKWDLNNGGSPAYNYTTLSLWQASFTHDNSADLQFNPDANAIGSLTTANFNNTGTRDYSPLVASALLTGGKSGGYIGCYNASSIAGSNLVGPGW